MQTSEGKDDSDDQRSRPSSRRNSVSVPRKNSLKKEKDKKAPQTTSAHSTPKRSARPSLDFMVTGKQLLKRSDRANSLPSSCRRQSSDLTSSLTRPQRILETPRRERRNSKSRDTSLEDDLSLDLSQVSDFEDTTSKYGVSQPPLATSTPMPPLQQSKTRSASLQSHMKGGAELSSRRSQPGSQTSVDLPRRQPELVKGRDSTFCSRDTLYKTSSSTSTFRCGTEDSSVSPEYSQSSESPRGAPNASPSPVLSSCYTHSWADVSGDRTAMHADGEWSSFWANYNNSLPKAPANSFYDQCPTPYRSDNADLDFELSTGGSRARTPDPVKHIGSIIRSEGLQLTPRETRDIVRCAHMLGNVLSHAIDRRARERDHTVREKQQIGTETNDTEDPAIDIKKKTLTLDLKETAVPEPKGEGKRCEATTQTDISLPNTKSAPRIFENILRQLSRSSIDVPVDIPKLEE